MQEITIIEVQPQAVIGLRRRGRYQQLIPTLLMEIVRFAMERGIPIAGPPVFLCRELTPEDVMRAGEDGTADIEVAFPVAGDARSAGDVRAYTLPGGTMARIVHTGAYRDCGPTYERLYAWLAENGRKITGPIREIYINDPREVPEKSLLTEIQVPIA